ncbi:tetraspanin-3-like [Babylonia areolata]|uniref:tetraspanin-3-like n=1 Tax=Babylonia areolata TaxID=304850 RepID=UPI003FD169AD
MGKCTTTTKICLLVISLVFWGAAASLCFISSWVYRTYHDFDHLTESTLTLVPASIVLGVAMFMFLIGLLGCIAVCKESKFLLSCYFCLILVVFLGELVAGVLGYAYRVEVEDAVSDGLTKAVDRYNETVMKEQIDFVQTQLHCCGIINASDWQESPAWSKDHSNTVPISCCVNQTNATFFCNTTIGSTDIYNEGCLSSLEDKFTTNLVYIASVTIAFALIQILGLISTCILICRTREVRYDRLENAQRDGLRV